VPAADAAPAHARTRVLFRFDHVNQDAVSLDEMLAILRSALLARREEWFERESSPGGLIAEPGENDAGAAPSSHDAAPALTTTRFARRPGARHRHQCPAPLQFEQGRARPAIAARRPVTPSADLLLSGLSAGFIGEGPVARSQPSDRGTTS
jgi:hypothetical protein